MSCREVFDQRVIDILVQIPVDQCCRLAGHSDRMQLKNVSNQKFQYLLTTDTKRIIIEPPKDLASSHLPTNLNVRKVVKCIVREVVAHASILLLLLFKIQRLRLE